MIKKFNQVVNESENAKRDYGCLMYNFKVKNWESDVLSLIDIEDVYDDDKHDFGVERNPHVTILYGFHEDEVSLDKIYDSIKDGRPIGLNIERVSVFNNKDYDVLKFDVNSKPLYSLNAFFKNNFKNTNDFPDYHPHMTICYLKKGTSEKYLDKFGNINLKIRDPKFKYSRANGSKIYFDVIK
jgi:2'-5' RNA ligase